MNREFSSLKRGDLHYLAFKGWQEEGLEHGFSGKAAGEDAVSGLENAFGLQKIFMLRQVHGGRVVNLSSRRALNDFISEGISADALKISRGVVPAGCNFGFLIRTADCVPVIARCSENYVLIHAGWRGLACGIIQNSLNVLIKDSDCSDIEALIGPCAGFSSYEVGSEVIEALGEFAVCERLRTGKYLLSLSDTVSRIMQTCVAGNVSIKMTGVCTIKNGDYNSYRREGTLTGRNLTFLIIDNRRCAGR